jgi:hypothetical protein
VCCLPQPPHVWSPDSARPLAGELVPPFFGGGLGWAVWTGRRSPAISSQYYRFASSRGPVSRSRSILAAKHSARRVIRQHPVGPPNLPGGADRGWVAIDTTQVRSAGVNPAGKLTSVSAGMAAGADSIDDLWPNSGGIPARAEHVLVYASATLGQFLREFTHGHNLQFGVCARARCQPG